MTYGLAGLICLTVAQFGEVQSRYREEPVWSYTLPNKTVVQVWENKSTGSSIIIYLNKLGRVCVLDIGMEKKPPSKETEKEKNG